MNDGRDSFTAWACARQAALLRTAFLITGDHHRAEDLVQEALIKVATRWSRLADDQPDAYARRVIANDNVSWWRRERRTVLSGLGDLDPVPVPAATGDVERRMLLHDALARLTRRQRTVLVLRHFDDLTEYQTAEALGISVGAVKSQNHRALARLREVAPELAQLKGDH